MEHGDHPFRILFLCTGNSARSVFAEYFLRRLGGQRFEVCSAGANPSGSVNPVTLKVLRERFRIDANQARSKSWEEFKNINFDFVITVCDNARESCPVWPGQPIIAHWGVNDPAAFAGPDDAKEQYFYEIALQLHRRVQLLVALPIEKLSRLKVEKLTREIGRS
jgi:arsenate reductase (thioredoxin)